MNYLKCLCLLSISFFDSAETKSQAIERDSSQKFSPQVELHDTVVNNIRVGFAVIERLEFDSKVAKGRTHHALSKSGVEYFASADERYLLRYSNANKNPVNVSLLSFARNGEQPVTIFLLQFEKITVTKAAWIGNNQCVLSTAAIEGIDEHIQPKYYLVTIN